MEETEKKRITLQVGPVDRQEKKKGITKGVKKEEGRRSSLKPHC